MSTSTQNQIRPTWDVKKLQEAATKMVAHKIASRLHFIDSRPGNEIEEMERSSAQLKARMLKECGVKTPLDLVKHMAEFEVNVFNAEASVSGDENTAVLNNEKPTVWLEAKKMVQMSKEQETKMHHHYKQWNEDLAEAFGFKAQVEISPDGNKSKITFSRK